MLPLRFSCFGLARRILGLTLLLVLGAITLGPVGAGPLPGQGVEEFRSLIDPKREPSPDPESAGPELADYRRKLRQTARKLPSLGEVVRVLLLSEWAVTEFDTESSVPLDQVKKAVRATTDEDFKRDVQIMMKKSDDSSSVNRAIVAEIKREVRLQMLDRLEQRIRFYLHEGRAVDRIAAANLIRDTMGNSRRQDISMYRPERDVAIPGVMRTTPQDIAPSSRSLRQRMRELSGDLKKETENSDSRVRAAAIHALSDVENDSSVLATVLKPLLTSEQSDAITRRAAAEALGHALEVNTLQMDKSRPLPYLRSLRMIMPVAAQGLDDSDPAVRRASLEACARAAQIFEELAGDPLSATERRAVFRPALAVMEEILPKINAAARDRVPAFRVAACHVLEALVLAMQKLQRYEGRPLPGEPLPTPGPGYQPSKPGPPPSSKEPDPFKKKSPAPSNRSGRGKAVKRPAQWAAAHPQQPILVPVPPVPFADERTSPDVALDRPTKLPSAPSAESSRQQAAPALPTAVFLAQPPDELPPPATVNSGLQETIQILIENLKDPDYRVRLASAGALESLGARAESAIPALLGSLRDSNKFVRWTAVRALGALNPRQAEDVVPGVMRLLDDREDPSVRIAAAKALEQYGEHAKAAVPLLARVINRGDKEYIKAILHTIQGIGTDAAPALPNVAWVLSDRTQPPSVRIEAAQTLGRFGALARDQLPILREVMINETEEDVRNAASSAVLAVDRPER